MLTDPPIIFRIVSSSADLGLRGYFFDDRQRQHMLLGHRGLQSAIIAIQSAVEGPTAIYRSKSDDNRFVFLSKNVQTGRRSLMKVIVERVGDEGKVITATWGGISYSGQLVWDASGALYTNYDDQHDVFYISKGATTDEYADDDPEFDMWLRKREDDDTPQGVTIFGLRKFEENEINRIFERAALFLGVTRDEIKLRASAVFARRS